MVIRLNESQLRRLFETNAKQLDLFMTPEESDEFSREGNKKLEAILREVEDENGWTHNQENDIDKGERIIHRCYPMYNFSVRRPVKRTEFEEVLRSRISPKYLEIIHHAAIRPEDWFVDVSINKA